MNLIKIKTNKIKIHYSFLIFVFLLLFLGKYSEILIVTLSIVLHEFVHILLYKLFSGETWTLELTMFGGVSHLYKYNKTKVSTIIIYIIGPIVNILIALLLYLLTTDQSLKSELIDLGIKYNLIMGIFCLLPVYPLDGYYIVKSLWKEQKYLNIINVLFLLCFISLSIYLKSIGLIIISLFLLRKNIMNKDNEKEKLTNYINRIKDLKLIKHDKI